MRLNIFSSEPLFLASSPYPLSMSVGLLTFIVFLGALLSFKEIVLLSLEFANIYFPGFFPFACGLLPCSFLFFCFLIYQPCMASGFCVIIRNALYIMHGMYIMHMPYTLYR